MYADAKLVALINTYILYMFSFILLHNILKIIMNFIKPSSLFLLMQCLVIVHWDGVGRNNVSHVHDLGSQTFDVSVVLLNCNVCFLIFLDQDLFLSGHSFQFVRELFSSCLKLLPFLDQLFQLKCIFEKLIFSNVLVSL